MGLVFSFGAAPMGIIAGTNEPATHTISFKAGDVTPGTYDDFYMVAPFTLHKDNAFKDADGTSYDIESVPYDGAGDGTYIINCYDNVTFGGDYIMAFDAVGGEEVNVRFALVKKAELDPSASFISYYVDVADDDHYYISDSFQVSTDTDPVYTTYGAFIDFYVSGKIMIDEVKLVFTCPR